jgi:hypothetical protein
LVLPVPRLSHAGRILDEADLKPHLSRYGLNYIRHGTLCLFANFEVATGRLVTPSLGPTRTEEDLVAHVRQTIATDPQAEWIFIVDQLNTHKSEGLAHLVAEQCQIQDALGVKDKSGLLKSRKPAKRSRKTSHRIRFVYTPKHTYLLVKSS